MAHVVADHGADAREFATTRHDDISEKIWVIGKDRGRWLCPRESGCIIGPAFARQGPSTGPSTRAVRLGGSDRAAAKALDCDSAHQTTAQDLLRAAKHQAAAAQAGEHQRPGRRLGRGGYAVHCDRERPTIVAIAARRPVVAASIRYSKIQGGRPGRHVEGLGRAGPVAGQAVADEERLLKGRS